MKSNKAFHPALAHPVLIAVTALLKVQREGGNIEDGRDLYDALCARAMAVGVRPMSEVFDRAAEYAGIPYSMEYDIYCSRELRDEGRRLYGHLYKNSRRHCC